MDLSLSGIVRRFGPVTALAGVDLAVAEGELLTILGPSGSGKTTLLKVVAGFEVPDEGTVLVGGQDVTLVPPRRRDVGMVFQNYALFPHLTVAQNVAFPLEMRRRPRAEIARRVAEALALVELSGYEARLPRQLSGGQQQRVALARAVVFGPSLLLTILGPSGSGKTTLLKVVAGFEVPDEGTVLVGRQDVTLVPPRRRDVGMVFQNYALFPHMTVAQNVAFPLEMRRRPRAETARRVAEALALVELSGYEARLPRQLSGGQQQRVALARAVVFGPSLLLLDEPFGALDRKLRESMQLEVRRLQRRLRLTTLFITHDQEEALILSDRVAVMNAGRIEQVGTPAEVYARPATRFVADFVGESNLLDGASRGDGSVEVPGIGQVELSGRAGPPSAPVTLLLRPEALRLGEAAAGLANSASARVVETVFLGLSVKLRLRLAGGGPELLARLPLRPSDPTPAVEGQTVLLGFAPEDVHVVARG